MTKKQSTAKGGTKGKAEGSKGSKATQINAEAEEFKARAVAYAQKAYGAALEHFEATEGKPGVPFFYTPIEASPKDVEDYYTDGLFFAGILRSKDCPKQFRDLFSAVFADMLGHASDTLGYTYVLPLMYPIVRDICDAQNSCGTAEGLHNALIYAVESMVPEKVAEAARAALKSE
jgi:hypothetical protein